MQCCWKRPPALCRCQNRQRWRCEWVMVWQRPVWQYSIGNTRESYSTHASSRYTVSVCSVFPLGLLPWHKIFAMQSMSLCDLHRRHIIHQTFSTKWRKVLCSNPRSVIQWLTRDKTSETVTGRQELTRFVFYLWKSRRSINQVKIA